MNLPLTLCMKGDIVRFTGCSRIQRMGVILIKKRGSHMSEKKLEIFGWVGTALSIIMYVSYIPQIIHNLNGIKGTPIQPFAAALSSD